MKEYFTLMLVGALLFLSGCTQTNIHLSDSFWLDRQQKIAVGYINPPVPALHKISAEGLVDLSIDAPTDIENYLTHLDISWYKTVPVNFVAELKQRGFAARLIERSLLEGNVDDEIRTNSDQFLTIKLEAIGARRYYENFVPTGAPEAYCVLTGVLVNKHHKIIWRYRAEAFEPIRGAWNQPPDFPHLTEAINTAVRSAQADLLDSFFSGH
jgi:hypothetical protein